MSDHMPEPAKHPLEVQMALSTMQDRSHYRDELKRIIREWTDREIDNESLVVQITALSLEATVMGTVTHEMATAQIELIKTMVVASQVSHMQKVSTVVTKGISQTQEIENRRAELEFKREQARERERVLLLPAMEADYTDVP